MEDSRQGKAIEIRSLELNFRDMAERTDLPDYRAKLLETAARLVDAATALEEQFTAAGT